MKSWVWSCQPIRNQFGTSESKWNRPETFEVWEIVQERKIDSTEEIFIQDKFTKIGCCRNKSTWNFLKGIFIQIETLSLVSFCFRIQPIDFKAELPLRKETGNSLNLTCAFSKSLSKAFASSVDSSLILFEDKLSSIGEPVLLHLVFNCSSSDWSVPFESELRTSLNSTWSCSTILRDDE